MLTIFQYTPMGGYDIKHIPGVISAHTATDSDYDDVRTLVAEIGSHEALAWAAFLAEASQSTVTVAVRTDKSAARRGDWHSATVTPGAPGMPPTIARDDYAVTYSMTTVEPLFND